MVSWYKSLIEDNVNYGLFSRKIKVVFYVMIQTDWMC